MAQRKDAETLVRLCNEIDALTREVRKIAATIPRKTPTRRAPKANRQMTKAIGAKVRACARNNPRWGIQRIGRLHRVDGGRVSEALNGKW